MQLYAHRERRIRPMAEPATSAAAGIAGWKIAASSAGAAGLGGLLAAIVVVCMRLPRTTREWVVALVSTLVCSASLGAVAIIKLGIADTVRTATTETDLMLALAGGIGAAFAAGLPGWMLVRAAFLWMDRREGRDLAELASDARADVARTIQ
jgi:hypothetical protein